MLMRSAGIDARAQARSQLFMDTKGLIHANRPDLTPGKREFAATTEDLREIGIDDLSKPIPLRDIVQQFRPTVLVGTSAQGGVFTEEVIREMSRHVARPAIFAFSNPTSKSECRPEDAIRWTDGRALVATGSPFEPVEYAGRRHTIGQGNNVFIFPGLGLGAIVSEAHEITDDMLLVAAQKLADLTGRDRLECGALYPKQDALRDVSREIACAVCRQARDTGVGRRMSDSEIERVVRANMWYPQYADDDVPIE